MQKRLFLLSILLCILTAYSFSNPKITFWDQQRIGTNCFNKIPPDSQWFSAAKKLGIEWVRLAYDKWDSKQRDFLMGDASDYKALVREDVETLKKVIKVAGEYHINIVIAPLSLPGARWRQNNGNKPDSRLWESFDYWKQANRFWKDLATELRQFDNVTGYTIVNEPAPELRTNIVEHGRIGDTEPLTRWYKTYKNTPHDLPKFYAEIIQAIREVDQSTPIVVESGWYAQPGAFTYWPAPLQDSLVLYAFHMYEPYEFTAGKNFREKNGYTYPGKVPFGNDTIYWNSDTSKKYLQPFIDWAARHHIPANRVIAAEFGCMRRNAGARQYLSDLFALFNHNNFHWAFYSFREDEWDGYDYELGSEGLPWSYWQAIERGEQPVRPWKDNPLFDVIKEQFK